MIILFFVFLEKALIKPMPPEVPEKRLKLSEKMQQKRLLMHSQPKKNNNLLSYETEDNFEIMNYTEDEGKKNVSICLYKTDKICIETFNHRIYFALS